MKKREIQGKMELLEAVIKYPKHSIKSIETIVKLLTDAAEEVNEDVSVWSEEELRDLRNRVDWIWAWAEEQKRAIDLALDMVETAAKPLPILIVDK